MKVTVKRAYEPAKPSDGTRVLVDRLWPRGVRKDAAQIDIWAKDLTPSSKLRSWFHADPEARYAQFTKKYQVELKDAQDAAKEIRKAKKPVTLVTAVKDIEHSHIPTLVAFLARR